MIKKLFYLLLFSITLFAQTDFETANEHYKKGDYELALRLFEPLAIEEHDNDAAYMLGVMYERGEGCKVDKQEAQRWYKQSSKGYYTEVQFNPNAEAEKETRKLYKSLNKDMDQETLETIKQYAESTYSIKAHAANYFLPASYRISGDYPPTYGHQAKSIETEFQFSLKYNFYTGLLGLDEVYSIGYTQRSFWQLYEYSAYFRETNYNPEIFITVPVGHVKNFDYLKAFRLSFEHQSNGRGGAEERSWNYVVGSFYVQTGFLFTEIKIWKDILNSLDYNPDLMKYMGHGEIQFILPYQKHILKFKSRNVFSDKRAFELNYSYPLSRSQDVFLYMKGFSGYGESLIDYNHKINKIGIGFSISR